MQIPYSTQMVAYRASGEIELLSVPLSMFMTLVVENVHVATVSGV